MAKGYFIRKGDKTSCGGEVLETDTCIMTFGFAHARAGDPVSCGKNDKTYEIVGGISYMNSHGRLFAGSLDSHSSCPCKAGLYPSFTTATYESSQGAAPQAARSAPQQEAAPVAPNHRNHPVSLQRGHPHPRSANGQGQSVKTFGAGISKGSKTSWPRAAN
ncbi:hypothetical protein EMIT0194P_120155 [Pseudomonas serbica]|jgi:uncharacterized Zn-binding protein involved in type VI secretion